MHVRILLILSDSNTKLHDARGKGRREKDEAKKDEAPTLESLKETVLELKKSLEEAGRKEHEDSKNGDSAKEKEESKDRKTRGKNKHGRDEKDEEGTYSFAQLFQFNKFALDFANFVSFKEIPAGGRPQSQETWI